MRFFLFYLINFSFLPYEWIFVICSQQATLLFFFSKLLRFVCKIFQYIVSFMESWREFFYGRIEQDRSKFHLEKG